MPPISRYLVAILSLGCMAAAAVQPETVGFSTPQLARLDSAMEEFVASKQLAGVITVVSRHGKVVNFKTHGMRDVASSTPMQLDTIFRIYSMSKPVTGVAMMKLFEEGKWKPEEAIAKYIPEFEALKVFVGVNPAGKPMLEVPAHAPTMGELMSYMAGFSYGFFPTPVDKLYAEVKPLEAKSLREFIARMAKLPLAYQPGEGWMYSVGVDVQGYLVERLSGMPFPQYLEQNIFKPLGMKDTAFYVPAGKLPRLATVYAPAEGGGLAPAPNDPNVGKPPGMPSGGGGLYSTAGDYLRFAQMLANGGALDGVRVLKPSSVAIMRTNHVPEKLRTGEFGIGDHRMIAGYGFGYNVAVFDDPAKAGSQTGVGTYGWDGAAGTWFWIDPANDVVFLGMLQRLVFLPGMPEVQELSRKLVHEALIEPGK
jgi:CubicO group peptidase (beta-lactamase class C family)